jgi:transketolase
MPEISNAIPAVATAAAPMPTQMANAIRALAMDAVQAANSGHPGAPMGMADIAVALWSRHLKHNPANPLWHNRDRFVLSNGHGSMLQYALLHLSGYDLPIDELKNFRKLHSRTPGHPEVDVTPGVETTTGPLGQGLANAVGMALAEKLLATEFNRPGHTVVDHETYVFMGDGCLMEGISHEACALAGAWKLNKLIALYDDNGISIDGQVAPWYIDDVKARFEAYGWSVNKVDGHDIDAVDAAIAEALKSATRPTLIVCKTIIGKGSPNRAGTSKAHGEALGAEEIALTRKALGWDHAPFEVPADIYAAWDAKAAGAKSEAEWNAAFAAYEAAFPELAAEFHRRMIGELPANFAEVAAEAVGAAHDKAETVASRKASQIALESFTAALPEMLGGSADLTGSNLTNTKTTPALRFAANGAVVVTEDKIGRHINYGVREFGMAALMKRRVIHVFTHDSIGLGEDGPTHQSVEHAASLRLIPGLDVWRPADTAETTVAWTMALVQKNRPSALLLSRQNLPYLPKVDADVITQGAYVLAEPSEVGLKKKAKIVLMATGSEVHLALQAQEALAKLKIPARVVSVPSTNVFDRQTESYKVQVLPRDVPRVAIEAGVTDGWWKYGVSAVVGLDRFGESAPAPDLFKLFGFTVDNIVAVARKVVGK